MLSSLRKVYIIYISRTSFSYGRPNLDFIENHAFLTEDETTLYYMANSAPDLFPVVEFNLTDFSSKVLFNLSEVVQDKDYDFWFSNGFSKKEGDWYWREDKSREVVSLNK